MPHARSTPSDALARLVSIKRAAIEHGLNYQTVWSIASTGAFGHPVATVGVTLLFDRATVDSVLADRSRKTGRSPRSSELAAAL